MAEDLSLIIGNKCYSSWSLRAWFFLKHSGLDFRERRIPLETDQWRREILDYSPSGKVPVLMHGEIRVWDSMAICEYVSETFLAGGGWPPDPAARALARSVSAEMHSGFPHLRAQLPMNCRRRFPGYPIPGDAAMDIARVLEIWDLCLARYAPQGPWLFGSFSIADAMFAPVALRFYGYDVKLSAGEEQYVRTVLDDEAVRDWIRAACRETETIAAEEADHPHVAFV